MARIFIDGFENNSMEFWSVAGNNYIASSSGVPGFKGNYCMRIYQNGYALKTLSTPLASMKMAFKIQKIFSGGYDRDLVRFLDSADNTCLSLIFNNISHKLEARLGSYNGTLLASGNTVFNSGETRHIEIAYAPLNSGGILTVRFGGVNELTYTGDTTAGLENITKIIFGTASSDYGVDMFLDDVVIDNTNWIGNTYIQKGQVSGAGTTTQFTPSAGANYQCIDEIPYSDTDYNSSNTVGHIDTFPITAITGAIISVKSVQLEARIAYEGTPTHIQLGCRSGGVNYFADDFLPILSFRKVSKILELNPDGNIEWTKSAVNAMEIGYKLTV